VAPAAGVAPAAVATGPRLFGVNGPRQCPALWEKKGEPREFDVEAWSNDALILVRERFSIDRMILIGYPDQFPFLSEGGRCENAFLWYQCSRPVLPPGLEHIAAVPLTLRTAEFLLEARHTRIGPVIPHGVDTKVFVPEGGLTNVPESPVLLTVGANSLRKRFDLLFEAVGALPPSFKSRLIVKTDTARKETGFDLPSLVERRAGAETVTIVDEELADSELAGLYRSADIYVHTAEWEGFGIPAIEAMASGLPVLTHCGQGPAELLPYSDKTVASEEVLEGSVRLRRISPRALAAAIVDIVGNPHEMSRLSHLGREKAEQDFDIRLVAERWEALF
jgi:glycosyltransferase involved in cell wall biosynthesis